MTPKRPGGPGDRPGSGAASAASVFRLEVVTAVLGGVARSGHCFTTGVVDNVRLQVVLPMVTVKLSVRRRIGAIAVISPWKPPADLFTGDVWFDVIAAGALPSRLRVNLVRFAPVRTRLAPARERPDPRTRSEPSVRS